MSNKDAALMKDIKIDADRLVAKNPADVATYMDGIQNVAYAHVGHVTNAGKSNNAINSDYLGILRSSLDGQVQNFANNSLRLMDYSDMYANNAYIRNELQEDTGRSAKRTAALRNNIFISKQNSQEYIYQTNRHKFMLFSLMLSVCTIFIVLGILRLAMRDIIKDSMTIFLIFVLSLVYIIAMVAMITRNAYRTRLDWTKFVWETNPDANLGTCAKLAARQNAPKSNSPAPNGAAKSPA
jgi:hypothetical protein